MRWISTGIVLLTLLAGPARAQPRAEPLPVLDVPFISQSEALCGGAAAAMVLRYWGARGLTADSFAHLLDRSASGIRTDALIADVASRGWNATGLTGTEALLSGELARGRPVLALIEDRPGTFHYVVIVAETDKAVVLHDPARAPFRIVPRAQFLGRWNAAARWMAVVLPAPGSERVDGRTGVESPGGSTQQDPPYGVAAATGSTPCDEMIAAGVRQAQAGDITAAERTLTSALSCPGASPYRELAGVRLLQRRWPEVTELASEAVAADPQDSHAWRLLGTSLFVQNERQAALDAWNRAGEPRVDLIRIDGLERTRQRTVEHLMDVRPGEVLTVDAFRRARRRLFELPSAAGSNLDYVPQPGGIAELKATVLERPLAPTGIWTYAAMGLQASARREVQLSIGSWAGGGERITGSWRFWPGRPGVSIALASPAPWGGTWAVDGSHERQPFDRPDLIAARRSAAGITVSDWFTSKLRSSFRGGLERWDAAGTYGTVSNTTRIVSAGDHLDLGIEAGVWVGSHLFSSAGLSLLARSSPQESGRVYVARGGFAAATSRTPLDRWFGGDTGQVRPVLLRAHSLLRNGALRTGQLGRTMSHVSLEARQWWSPGFGTRAGAAVFADAVRVDSRLTSGARSDIDLGIGGRLALPGLRGFFRLDLARGLRDGETALSFVYEP